MKLLISRRRRAIALLVALVTVALVLWELFATSPVTPAPPVAAPAPKPHHLKPSNPDLVGSCRTSAKRPFEPRNAVLRDGHPIQVYAAAREPGGIVPGVPPVTNWGKGVFGWDAPGVWPGTRSGVVVMDAHSWPDSSALGNWLMTHLSVGQTLILHGDRGQRQCYRIISKKIYPAAKVPWEKTYGPVPPGAPARLTITICYWPRLGPENWANREVWVAKPY